ncbi:hypothetical protein F5B20DRAFT_581172 [Whalleya microplaca]|nr:hypothetical protein F5B20DRAFT_581172 [Whalleya microplaca]
MEELLIDLEPSRPDEGHHHFPDTTLTDLLTELDNEGDLQNCPILEAGAYSSRTATTVFDGLREKHQEPGPLTYPASSHCARTRHSTIGTRAKARACRHVKANFIISHKPDLALGVIEAVYKELSRANSTHTIELRKTGDQSYLHIAAPAKDTAELVKAAGDLAEELISDQPTEGAGIFQEPPPKAHTSFHIVLDIMRSSREARPRLEPQLNPCVDGTTSLERHDSFEEYKTSLDGILYRALKKAGRLSLSLALRVNLGFVMLQTYQQGNDVYDYNAFHTMVKNPRASGRLETVMGNEALARKLMDFVRSDDSNSPFQPTDNRMQSAAQVLPEYFLQADSLRAKFEAPLNVTETQKGRTSFIQSVTVSEKDPAFAELDILNLSVGKKLDWNFESTDQQKGARKYPIIVQYLTSARTRILDKEPEDAEGLGTYPRVLLPTQNSIAAGFTSVAIKTVYRLRWKHTSYVVLVAINRRWPSIAAMIDLRRPGIDVGISICGEDWDKEGRVAANIWGDELQHLLCDAGEAPHDGMARVANFLQVIRDVRDVLEPLF